MKNKHEHWHPPQYTQYDVRALQALHDGEASPEDQKRVLRWLIEQATGTYDEPFRPESQDTVAYMLGRRSVGLAIIKLLHLTPEVFDNRGDTRDFRDDDRGRRPDGRQGRRPNRLDGRYDDNNRDQRPRDDEPYRDG